MKSLLVSGLAGLLAGLALAGTPGWAKDRTSNVIPKGEQVGVVNLLNAEVMHYHVAEDSNNSFWKIRTVKWPVDNMLAEALEEPAEKLGLTLTPLAPTDALKHARESCFVNAALADGLPKRCWAPLTDQAASGSVSYLIIMAPGLNDTNHAGSSRIESVSEKMRGWGFLTRERAGAKDKPTLFNEVELLLINVTPQGVALKARQWGGLYGAHWQSYTLPADPKAIPDEQLDQLQPIFASMLARQAKDLLDQVHSAP
jgi:hypothetical protein